MWSLTCDVSSLLLIGLGLLLFVFLSLQSWPSPRTYFLLRKLPRVEGWPVIGSLILLATLKPNEYLSRLMEHHEKYPRCYVVWLTGIPIVCLHEPEDIEVVLSNVNYISKGMEYGPIKEWLREGLLTSSGLKWHRRRKLLTNAFHFRILEDAVPIMNKNAKFMVQKLQATKNEEFQPEDIVKHCTLQIICEAAMGVSLETLKDKGKEYVTSINSICEIIIKKVTQVVLQSPLIFFFTPYRHQFKKSLRVLKDFTSKVINDRRLKYYTKAETGPTFTKKRHPFLDTLLEFEKNNPGSFTQDDIREEVDTFTFEGHDTTSAAIVSILFCLGHDQAVQDKVVEELYNIFGTSDRDIELNDLPKMDYLEKVIKEALRLFPSVPYLSRTLDKDVILNDGVVIPEGVNLIVVPYCVHRNKKIFEDPEKFDPERFNSEKTQNRHPFAYIPFSAGPRNCIGQKFAMMEMKVVIATVLRKLQVFSITKREELVLLPLLILRPETPIRMKVVMRSGLH